MVKYDIQSQLMRAILDDTGAPSLEGRLLGPNALPPEVGIAQYRVNRKATLCKVLENIYPVCGQILGESCFKGVMHRYIQQHPVTHFRLDLYGDCFSTFLKTMPFAPNIPYLPEVAALELAIHQVLLGTEAKVMHTQYAVDEIWDAHQKLSIHAMPELTLSQTAHYLLIWRETTTIRLKRFSSMSCFASLTEHILLA